MYACITEALCCMAETNTLFKKKKENPQTQIVIRQGFKPT